MIESSRCVWLGIVRVRAAAVAEAVIAAARIEQTVVGRSWLRGRIETHEAHRVRQVHHDVRPAIELAPGPFEHVRGGILRPPLGDHVVVRDVLHRVARRNEVERRRVAHRALAVHGVKEAVLRELGMEVEPDEAALQPVVDRVGKEVREVEVDSGLVVLVEQIEESARVVREAATVGQVADELHARPPGRVDVLIERTQFCAYPAGGRRP